MPAIELPYNWEPRRYQLSLWRYLENGGGRAVAIWHRRSGKDDLALHWTATSALKRQGNYWHLLPQASQARKAVWDAVNPHTGRRRIDEAFPRELRDTTREQEMMIKFKNGSTWQVVGSDNYNSLVGSPPVGVVFSEWALADPAAWAFLRPILLENDGWALFISTPRGHNHAATMYESAISNSDWFAELLTVEDTGVFSAEQIERERREYHDHYGPTEGEAHFRQEYYCDFEAAVPGAYYAEALRHAEQEGRVTKVPHDPAASVETWWDLGVSDATAIWFVQYVGKEIHVIDYYEQSGEPLAHYATVLDEKRQKHGYNYSRHIAPHDIEARELGTGKPRIKIARQLGIRFDVCPRHYVQDRIEATRNAITRCWFDRDACKRGLEALKQYRKEWDDKRQTFKPHPLHDWTSHAADAFGYGCFAEPKQQAKLKARKNRPAPQSWMA
jgi:hypothetical protein